MSNPRSEQKFFENLGNVVLGTLIVGSSVVCDYFLNEIVVENTQTRHQRCFLSQV